jgi:hypothetical protein
MLPSYSFRAWALVHARLRVMFDIGSLSSMSPLPITRLLTNPLALSMDNVLGQGYACKVSESYRIHEHRAYRALRKTLWDILTPSSATSESESSPSSNCVESANETLIVVYWVLILMVELTVTLTHIQQRYLHHQHFLTMTPDNFDYDMAQDLKSSSLLVHGFQSDLEPSSLLKARPFKILVQESKLISTRWAYDTVIIQPTRRLTDRFKKYTSTGTRLTGGPLKLP